MRFIVNPSAPRPLRRAPSPRVLSTRTPRLPWWRHPHGRLSAPGPTTTCLQRWSRLCCSNYRHLRLLRHHDVAGPVHQGLYSRGCTHETSAVAGMLRISILTLYPADSASARFCCHAVEAPGGIAKRRHGPIRVYRPQTSPNRPLGTLVYRPPVPLPIGDGDGHGSDLLTFPWVRFGLVGVGRALRG